MSVRVIFFPCCFSKKIVSRTDRIAASYKTDDAGCKVVSFMCWIVAARSYFKYYLHKSIFILYIMKKYLYLILLFFKVNHTHAQVVFCPPGAEWHYASIYLAEPPLSGNLFNTRIKYIHDSIVGQDTCKVLQHEHFFTVCNLSNQYTVIKQKGDTVFFRNSYTSNTWQILYNFNVQAGQTWVTAINDGIVGNTHTITVQSVGSVTLNGFPLKKLSVTDTYFGSCYLSANVSIGSTITEKLGSNGYLFNFSYLNSCTCDYDSFFGPLCYQDSSFGVYKFSSRDCNYFDTIKVGLPELQLQSGKLLIYPNPAHDLLHSQLRGSDISIGDWHQVITNNMGQIVIAGKRDGDFSVDIHELANGFYVLQVFNANQLVNSTKFVKN